MAFMLCNEFNGFLQAYVDNARAANSQAFLIMFKFKICKVSSSSSLLISQTTV